VEGRPVGPDDTVIVDLVTPGGESRRDYVIELGRGAVVDEVENGVLGMNAGETKELDFELARSASEFETLDELRTDIETRLREQIGEELEARFRSDVVDALVSASKVDISGPLVEARTRELLRGLARQVEARGIALETYLAMTGQQPEQLVARLGEEAARSVARELVLEAAADALDLHVSDEEVESLVREQADALGDDADETLQRLRESGRFESLREDLRLRNALDRVADEVKRIPRELADAREAIWTPDKEKQPTETKLWTPGS